MTSTKQPEIVELEKIIHLAGLTIPNYQRPYRWSKESTATLFNDLYLSFKSNVQEYRIGSVVLHEDAGKYNIVDGQQRLTTISILTYCFYGYTHKDEHKSKLLSEENAFNDLSSKSIVENYRVLRKKFADMPDMEKGKFIEYVLHNCTFVKIITNSEQEAFQFFDSQNSRGKELSPHDLLKSYHLREMKDEPADIKVKLVESWESINQKNLAIFFETHMYPLVKYYRSENGLYYSASKIKTFKGISSRNTYHFSTYHKAANLYIEHFNLEGMYEIANGEKANQFQLTQPLIAGKRFFQYTLYYYDLCEKITSIINSEYKPEEVSTKGSGNTYVRNLFVNILVFFVDKFNLSELTKARLDFFYQWAYTLRIVMQSVYLETTNKYALGLQERANQGKNLFKVIESIQSPSELDSIILDDENSLKVYEPKPNESNKLFWDKIFGGQK